MAPEQLRGKARPASDQYALSIMVYEWLCGERPFRGTATEIAMQHLLEPPPSLREKVPTISLEVEQVVMRALAKDPAQRFHTILEFAEALEKAANQFNLKLLFTLPRQTGDFISHIDWIWGNHYLFFLSRKKMNIIDVLTGEIVFSEVLNHRFVAVFWQRENCIANFPKDVISLTEPEPYSPHLVDVRSGKTIATIATDDVSVDVMDEKHEGFDAFSRSSEGKKIIKRVYLLAKSGKYYGKDYESLVPLFERYSYLRNSIDPYTNLISFCPPQWQLVAIASADGQRKITQIKVYRVAKPLRTLNPNS